MRCVEHINTSSAPNWTARGTIQVILSSGLQNRKILRVTLLNKTELFPLGAVVVIDAKISVFFGTMLNPVSGFQYPSVGFEQTALGYPCQVRYVDVGEMPSMKLQISVLNGYRGYQTNILV